MRVLVLASGSKGNAIYVEMDGTRLLLDAGISATRIRNGLAEHGIEAADLDGVLITHEHNDHIAGLVTLEKWYHFPIYSRAGTFAHMTNIGRLPRECLHPITNEFMLGKVRIEAFSILHDAADPVGYRICGSENCTLATDLGFVSSGVQEALEGSDVLVLEANHDPDILKKGSYSWPLKQRILSNRGHLANSDAAWALARMRQVPAYVFLAHLSEENNRPELAKHTIQAILEQQGVQTELLLTSQTEITELPLGKEL